MKVVPSGRKEGGGRRPVVAGRRRQSSDGGGAADGGLGGGGGECFQGKRGMCVYVSEEMNGKKNKGAYCHMQNWGGCFVILAKSGG